MDDDLQDTKGGIMDGKQRCIARRSRRPPRTNWSRLVSWMTANGSGRECQQ